MTPTGNKASPLIELKQLRHFGWIVGGILACIALWPMIKGNHRPNWFALAPSVALLAASLMKPLWLTPIYRAWMWLGTKLGHANTAILLSAIFFLILTPFGLISKLIGKRDVRFDFKPSQDSYWTKRKPAGDWRRSLEKPF